MADANKKTVTTEELKEELNKLITCEPYTINNIFIGDTLTTTKGYVEFNFAYLGDDVRVCFLECYYHATGDYTDLTEGTTFMSQVMSPTKNYGPFDFSMVKNNITYQVRSVWDGIGLKYRYTLIVELGEEITTPEDVKLTTMNILT